MTEMKLRVKGWADFQHYKDRSPPWIKLHKSLLDNYEYQSLPIASRALAPMLWLLASESADGSIDGDTKKLAFRLRCSAKEIDEGVKALIDAGFLVSEGDASKPLATGEQLACLETEVETETEREVETESSAEPAFVEIPLTGNQTHKVTASKVEFYRKHYPAVDVEQELRKMAVWCDANPTRRKTRRGVEAFIANWLSKSQDRPTAQPAARRNAEPAWREEQRSRIAQAVPSIAAKTIQQPRTIEMEATDVTPLALGR